MKKHILSLAMALAVCLSLAVPASAADIPFTDVPDTFRESVAWAVEKGVTNGTSATTFGSSSDCTHNHILTFIWRANGSPAADGDGDFAKAVNWAKGNGTAPADISGGDKCTRAQAMVYLWKLAGSPKAEATSSFTDVDAGASYAQAVAWAVANGITNGTGGGTFSPDQVCSRGQIVTFLYRAQNPDAAVKPSAAPAEPAPAAPASSDAVTKVSNSYSLPSGSLSADVITVNTADPSVKVKVAMVNNTLGATADFSSIVASAAGAKVVVNANFFESYQDFKVPIGYVMADGQTLYGVSGLTSFGFTNSGEIRVGKPSVFFFVEGGGNSWACYECNSPNGQDYDTSVVYTPAYGQSVSFTTDGLATTVTGGVIQGSQNVTAGGSLPIPADGFVMFFGPGFTSTDYYRAPAAGTSVTLNARSRGEGLPFNMDGVTNMVTGAPCLVENGAICTRLDDGFNEARFTSNASPRTAIGKLSDGKLVIVSTGSATVQQLRELMLQLGCTDAINLDGGASTALAWEGKVVRPAGRQLTTTLQVFA